MNQQHDASDSNWNSYSRLVLQELERLNGCQKANDEKLTKILVEIAILNVKSSIWGGVGAIVAMILAWGLKQL